MPARKDTSDPMIDKDQLEAAKDAAANLDEPALAKARAAVFDSQGVVAPNDDEEVREYTVQHSAISLPNGRILNAGQTVSSDDLRSGRDWTKDEQDAAEQRFQDVGAVLLTKTITRRVQAQRKAAEAAAKAAAAPRAGVASDEAVRLGLGNVATPSTQEINPNPGMPKQ